MQFRDIENGSRFRVVGEPQHVQYVKDESMLPQRNAQLLDCEDLNIVIGRPADLRWGCFVCDYEVCEVM